MSGAQQQSRSVASQSPYAQLFRIPGAKAFCISGAVARLPISMMSLGIVLALNHMYDNWTVAGSMSAMYILAVAAVTPFYARLFDRFGQRRVGPVALGVQIVAMLAFALAALCISACDSRRQPLFTANPLGAGPVLLTVSAAQIPASHPGLYDTFTTDRTPAGETVLRFTLAGEPVMEARAYGDEIESIEIFGPGVGSTDGIAPGTDVKHLFENGGISQTDNDGRLVITLNGMTYRVSGLGEEGRKKLGKAHADGVTPRISPQDFDPGAKVTSILIN